VGSSVASDNFISISSGHGGTFGAGTFSPRSPVVLVGYGDPSASAYTYAWSTGDTTEDVTGLGLGPVSVTVTDCNGCTGSWTGFLLVNITAGCTDPTMFNYDPFANLDDGSCIPFVYGCIDTTALNYVPTTANTDDGSCTYPCLVGVGANSESFEDPAVGLYGQGPWANWTYDAATSTFTGTNGWRKDNLGTGSSGTGPANGAASLDSSYYLYCETSGQYNQIANLNSECIDLTNFSAPAFLFGYNMFGATIGTLNVDISTDNAATWINAWTLSGDQGQAWQEAAISLGAYAGQIVRVRMSYTSGTSFTGDCAIDNLRFMESPALGCMDALAYNYDTSATFDDGSCLYIMGCTDPNSCNYDSLAVMDDGGCYILSVSASMTDVLCYGDTNGTATALANTSPVTYLWSNGETSATISGLLPGTYSVTVADNFGCIATDSTTVGSPTQLTASLAVGMQLRN